MSCARRVARVLSGRTCLRRTCLRRTCLRRTCLRRTCLWRTCLGLTALLVLQPDAFGYDSQLHQELTFIAAKQFNRCAAQSNLEALTPLHVRFVAKSSVRQADIGLFRRLFRWNYFDRAAEGDRTFLWLVDTRFNDRFDQIVERLEDAPDDRARYDELGRVVSLIQDATVPAYTVPVGTFRLWRLSFSDRFDRFPIDTDRILDAIAGRCPSTQSQPAGFLGILAEAAEDTIAGVQARIDGMPASWQVFWKLADDPGDFGEYGRAGNNFGQKTEFRCGDDERCVLLANDPLYRDFAFDRHVTAVVSTMRAMVLLQAGSAPAARGR